MKLLYSLSNPRGGIETLTGVVSEKSEIQLRTVKTPVYLIWMSMSGVITSVNCYKLYVSCYNLYVSCYNFYVRCYNLYVRCFNPSPIINNDVLSIHQ